MAEIIRLNARFGAVRCPAIGITFPVVYRLTGCSWKDADGGRLEPNPEYPWTEYTLSDEPTEHIANTVFTPITRLDPALDSGWVIVRHLANQSEVRGYLHGRHDTALSRDFNRVVWQTTEGLFTILHRPAIEECEDHFLIYSADVPADNAIGEDIWTHVIKSDGTITDDTALYPPEPDA